MICILWIDDEIDLLKPHIIYLEEKGYSLMSAKSGDQALELLQEQVFDLIFLDENMPGISGLETLSIIKEKYSSIPVIMITKSEEESIMEEAIGSKISDYLIKPVNPNQILSSIKRNLDVDRLVHNKVQTEYRKDYSLISESINQANCFDDWVNLSSKLYKGTWKSAKLSSKFFQI